MRVRDVLTRYPNGEGVQRRWEPLTSEHVTNMSLRWLHLGCPWLQAKSTKSTHKVPKYFWQIFS